MAPSADAPGQMQHCYISADNSFEPLRTWPSNFFWCGADQDHVKWVIFIHRQPDGEWTVRSKYWPTNTDYGWVLMDFENHTRQKASAIGPNNQECTVTVHKVGGNPKKPHSVKAWIEAECSYLP